MYSTWNNAFILCFNQHIANVLFQKVEELRSHACSSSKNTPSTSGFNQAQNRSIYTIIIIKVSPKQQFYLFLHYKHKTLYKSPPTLSMTSHTWKCAASQPHKCAQKNCTAIQLLRCTDIVQLYKMCTRGRYYPNKISTSFRNWVPLSPASPQ